MDTKRDEVRYISQFEHENAVMHYGKVNHRSMIMLICSCVTILLIVAIFVVGYTIRERDIMKLLTRINAERGTAVVMVTHNRSIFEKYPGRVFICRDESCTERKDNEVIDLALTI